MSYLFTPQMATMAGARPRWIQEPRTPSEFPIWMAGTPVLGPSCAVVAGAWTGSCAEPEAIGIQSDRTLAALQISA